MTTYRQCATRSVAMPVSRSVHGVGVGKRQPPWRPYVTLHAGTVGFEGRQGRDGCGLKTTRRPFDLAL
jgi:hypothetical protein